MSTLLAKSPSPEYQQGCVAHGFEQLAVEGPFWWLFDTFAGCSDAFLLDSSLASTTSGRYSFLGEQPVALLRASRANPQSPPFETEIEIQRIESAGGEDFGRQPQTEKFSGDALEALRGLLAEYAVPFQEGAQARFPFLGGAVGFFGYEAGSWGGPGETVKTDETNIPDVYFAVYDRLLCHDHATKQTYASVVGRGATADAANDSTKRAMQTIREKVAAARHESERIKEFPARSSEAPPANATGEQQCCFDEASYCRAVQTVREHIQAGDIYQACMTQRFQSNLGNRDPWKLYCQLRATNPAPFGCYLQTPEFCVASASPERFLAVDRHGTAESRPIKGTRPRGKTPEQDAALQQELRDSEKDRAENVMIVDLVRNDFGRVCRFGSIDVSALLQIESYATVFQLVSTVRGQLAVPHDALDLVRATFPGGSMTGAPKIEAMKILDRLEPVRRGIYSGGIGYLDYAGSMDLNMVIRSFIIENQIASYHAGGGVVADSDPKAEYQESLDKVVALRKAFRDLEQDQPAGSSLE